MRRNFLARSVLYFVMTMACAGRLGAQSPTFEVLQSFSGSPSGAHPEAPVIQGSDGNFYGTTNQGGDSNGDGTVFEVTSAGVLTTLHTFAFADGSNPVAGLTLGTDGNFYGTTANGGPMFGDGTVFMITPAGVFTSLYAFTGDADGAFPEAALTLGSDGNFYSTTVNGGAHGDGTVFKITPAGALTTLYSFAGGAEGAFPQAGLTLGRDGNFYGTTQGGGSNSVGTVFQITPAGVLTTLYAFTGGADGSDPVAGLTLGSDGNFYGITQQGGGPGDGTIFKITPAGALTTLYSFAGGADGSVPLGGLTLASDGDFYGTTVGGGGTIYRVTPAGVLTTLYSFTGGAAGGVPEADLIQGNDGNLYGTTYNDGLNSLGAVFRLDLPIPAVSSETVSTQLTSPFSFQIVATNNPTAFAASNLPTGLSVNAATGLISGTPTQSGTFTIGLSATNSFDTGAGTLTLTVDPAAPVITSASAASGQEGQPFNYQITASNGPTSYGASGLPAGLSVDTAKGVISGTPTVSGTFTVSLSATNSGGTGTSALTLTLTPVVTLAATVPQVVLGSGESGEFTVSIPAPQSVDIIISYTIKGTAINGVDYQLIKASKKIKAGKTSKIIKIVPQGDLEGASKKVVTLVLTPGSGYTIGTTGKVKVKILSAP